MSALHWLAFNNDEAAIKSLLELGADHLMLSHDKLLPIDVAGTTPSFASLDAFLDQFQKENALNPQEDNRTSALKGLNDFVVPTETAAAADALIMNRHTRHGSNANLNGSQAFLDGSGSANIKFGDNETDNDQIILGGKDNILGGADK